MPRVNLTHPERVLFPDDGITKGDLFPYYERIAPALVPHLRDRPFTLKRYPHGITGEVYFQKQVPRGAPDWIPTRRFTTHPREGGSREVDFALINSPDAVLWTVQMNCIDMNAWYSRVDKPGRPDFVVFDLDPPGRARRLRAGDRGGASHPRAARRGRAPRLREDERRRRHPRPRADPAPRRLRRHVRVRRGGVAPARAAASGLVTTEWLKKKRAGVLVDHRQNGWGKTIASVYSVRPKPGAPVSTPLRWEELTTGRAAARLLAWRSCSERVERDGDLFAPVLEDARPLGAAARELARLVP